MFANTVNGADASALYYSLIETAKANGINTYDYLWYVLEKSKFCSTDTDWVALLPWNMDTEYLESLKKHRDSAKPDPERIEPYIFRGIR